LTLLGGFGLFGVLVVGMFVLVSGLVVAILVVVVVRGGAQWSSNNKAPVSTALVTVVTKRTDTWGGMNDTSASTSYYATFQLPDGERLELPVTGTQFGQLVEGDRGQLTHQGTRFQGFTRVG
jgi:hypothetical protein